VRAAARAPGEREARWAHLLCGEVTLPGHPALRLWVIAGNPAEQFYAAMGARPVAETCFDAHGRPIRECCRRVELTED
jgi:hypothetical protein